MKVAYFILTETSNKFPLFFHTAMKENVFLVSLKKREWKIDNKVYTQFPM